MDREAWRAVIHGVTKSRTQLSDWTELNPEKSPFQPLMDHFEGFNTSVKEVTTGVVEIARKLELKVEPKDVSELLQFQAKTWMDEELLLSNV